MIKFKSNGNKPLIGLGLSEGNVKKLRKVPKKGIPPENATERKPIGSVGEVIDPNILKELLKND